jgi:DNA-binding GntR family transcriptional regulator
MTTTNPEEEDPSRRSSLPLYEVIYGVLRAHIVDGSFPPGLVLGQSSVARAFRSSRVPAGTALRRLHDEGLLVSFDGRGYMAKGREADPAPLRLDLERAGLRLPAALTAELAVRNRRERIYPEIEHAVAACLSYGRFLVNESGLAEHYGVSRTVAHEVLTRLERMGLVTQDTNQRWYAGPLTEALLSEHYEMRWLLEPIALGQVLGEIDARKLRKIREQTTRAQRGKPSPGQLERLEKTIHVDIVLRCHNRQLRETIRRSQLPIIATHSTFERFQNNEEIAMMLSEHLAVIDSLLAGAGRRAMKILEAHLRRSLPPNVALLRSLGPMPQERRLPFLVAVAS